MSHEHKSVLLQLQECAIGSTPHTYACTHAHPFHCYPPIHVSLLEVVSFFFILWPYFVCFYYPMHAIYLALVTLDLIPVMTFHNE